MSISPILITQNQMFSVPGPTNPASEFTFLPEPKRQNNIRQILSLLGSGRGVTIRRYDRFQASDHDRYRWLLPAQLQPAATH